MEGGRTQNTRKLTPKPTHPNSKRKTHPGARKTHPGWWVNSPQDLRKLTPEHSPTGVGKLTPEKLNGVKYSEFLFCGWV